jgi:uncharacterized protein (TIGR02001 family)
MTNKTLALMAAALTAGALAPTAAFAEDYSLAFNVGAVSDYRYRGISQSRLNPAAQGGIDLGLPAGFYAGAWASQISWISDAGGGADVEIDVYGGWKGEVYKGLTLDLGALTYQYPGNDLNPSANTTELYGALTYDVVTAKYSHSLTNLFGFAESESSWYLEIAATLEGPYGISITPHAGHQRVENNPAACYNDYSLTFSKDFNGLVPSVSFVGTSTPNYVDKFGNDLGSGRMVVGVKYNF